MRSKISKIWRELTDKCLAISKSYEELNKKFEDLERRFKEKGQKKEVRSKWTQSDLGPVLKETREKWTQSRPGLSKIDVSIQVQDDSYQPMEVANEEGEGQVLNKLNEILIRVKVLEKKEKKGNINNIETEDATIWSKLIVRRKKNQNIQERRDKDERRNKNKDEEAIVRRKRNIATSLQAMRTRLPKGAGVLLEIRGGTQQEYQVLKSCQEKINLDELGIHPIGLRRARGERSF